MSKNYDVIVIGAGAVGAATAFFLNKLGGAHILLLDRGPVCSGGTARSCAVVRSHYSIPSNTQLTLNSLEIFTNFSAVLEDESADCGFVNSGYLILASAGNGR